MTVARFGSHAAWTALTVIGMNEQAPQRCVRQAGTRTRRWRATSGTWDGRLWTDHVAPGQPVRVEIDNSVWVTIGWIFAFVFPIAGFVIGFCLPRKYSQQGLWIMAVSVVVGVIFLAIYPR